MLLTLAEPLLSGAPERTTSLISIAVPGSAESDGGPIGGGLREGWTSARVDQYPAAARLFPCRAVDLRSRPDWIRPKPPLKIDKETRRAAWWPRSSSGGSSKEARRSVASASPPRSRSRCRPCTRSARRRCTARWPGPRNHTKSSRTRTRSRWSSSSISPGLDALTCALHPVRRRCSRFITAVKLLVRVQRDYRPPAIYITENGTELTVRREPRGHGDTSGPFRARDAR